MLNNLQLQDIKRVLKETFGGPVPPEFQAASPTDQLQKVAELCKADLWARKIEKPALAAFVLFFRRAKGLPTEGVREELGLPPLVPEWPDTPAPTNAFALISPDAAPFWKKAFVAAVKVSSKVSFEYLKDAEMIAALIRAELDIGGLEELGGEDPHPLGAAEPTMALLIEATKTNLQTVRPEWFTDGDIGQAESLEMQQVQTERATELKRRQERQEQRARREAERVARIKGLLETLGNEGILTAEGEVVAAALSEIAADWASKGFETTRDAVKATGLVPEELVSALALDEQIAPHLDGIPASEVPDVLRAVLDQAVLRFLQKKQPTWVGARKSDPTQLVLRRAPSTRVPAALREPTPRVSSTTRQRETVVRNLQRFVEKYGAEIVQAGIAEFNALTTETPENPEPVGEETTE